MKKNIIFFILFFILIIFSCSLFIPLQRIKVKPKNFSKKWHTAKPIEDNTCDSSNPVIVINNSGNAIIGWSKININDAYYNIWAIDYFKGIYGKAQIISKFNKISSSLNIVIENSGNAMAI